MKKEYFDCGCSSLHCVVRLAYFPEDKDYLYVETYLRPLGFFGRVWRSFLYVIGRYVPYNDTCLEPETVGRMRDTCNEFLNYDFIPAGNCRGLFDWMVKYDLQLADRPKEIIAAMLVKGAEQLYKEGLENADPLPPDVFEALVESQNRALEEALKEKPEDDCS